NKFTENNYVRLWTEGEILYWEYLPEALIQITAAREIMDMMNSLCGTDQFFVLQDMSNLKWIDKASRNYFAYHSVTNSMHAWAFHSMNPLHKNMYSIYVTLSKPDVKTNFFRTSEESMNWLKNVKRGMK